MENISNILGQIAGFLALLQVVPYVVSILRHRTRPSRTTYGIWLLVAIINYVGYVAAGATTTQWLPLALAVSAFVIFCLSLPFGMGGIQKLDIVCWCLAVIAIVIWVVTDNPSYAVYTSTLAWSIAYLPTIKKSYQQPNTESTLSWSMYFAAAILNVCALTTLSPVVAIPPLLSMLLSGVVAGLLIFPARSRAKL